MAFFIFLFFFFQAEDGIRDPLVTGVQTCALPIYVLLDQGRVALDPKKRKEIYDQAQRLMIEKATQIWTFAPDMIDVTQGAVQYQQHFTTAYYGFRTVRLS